MIVLRRSVCINLKSWCHTSIVLVESRFLVCLGFDWRPLFDREISVAPISSSSNR